MTANRATTNANAREASLSPPPLKKRKVESATTKKAVASFFTPASKKEPAKVTWRVINESLLFANYHPNFADTTGGSLLKRRKIAAFDLDSTLIQTASGNVFAKDATDWRWWHSSVPSVLKDLHADGYAIAIITNQGSVSLRNDPKTIKSDQRSLGNFKIKVASVLSHFDFPILLLAATARDRYRKPRIGTWNQLLEDLDLDEGEGPILHSSFFVGDAGGRAARTNSKADHACSDRDFASNVGIAFHTPEEYFMHEQPVPFSRSFEPSAFLNGSSSTLTHATPLLVYKETPLDIVLLCGSPGCGKSTFYWTKLKPFGYERINQDTLKTRDKCLKVASEMLAKSKSIAIDNTNADHKTRAVWVQLAHKFAVPIRCFYFPAPAKLCQHNDTIRALSASKLNPEKRTILPHSAFVGFTSRFKEPKVTEGFQDVVKVEFQHWAAAYSVANTPQESVGMILQLQASAAFVETKCLQVEQSVKDKLSTLHYEDGS